MKNHFVEAILSWEKILTTSCFVRCFIERGRQFQHGGLWSGDAVAGLVDFVCLLFLWTFFTPQKIRIQAKFQGTPSSAERWNDSLLGARGTWVHSCVVIIHMLKRCLSLCHWPLTHWANCHLSFLITGLILPAQYIGSDQPQIVVLVMCNLLLQLLKVLIV